MVQSFAYSAGVETCACLCVESLEEKPPTAGDADLGMRGSPTRTISLHDKLEMLTLLTVSKAYDASAIIPRH